MTIDVSFWTLTGPAGNVIPIEYPPTTGPNGDYDVAVDPIGGPAQVQDTDFSLTGSSGYTGRAIDYNLANSSLKSVRAEYIASGETGPVVRLIYNY